jgi:eukaryotic-like serine/threonine-protein kinase
MKEADPSFIVSAGKLQPAEGTRGMAESNIDSLRVRFGQFEADISRRRLLKRGVIVRLENRPFQLLVTLLERPGELVTREELQGRLWPVGTYVGFDEGLNTAVRKLRIALGDSTDSPLFIETVPRRGYIFIAPITTDSAPGLATPSDARLHFVASAESAPPDATSDNLGPGRRPRKALWAAAIFATILCIAGIAVWKSRRLSGTRQEPEFVRLSFERGLITSARFAPDGQTVVYGAAWNGHPFKLFLTRPGSPDVLPLRVEADVLSISRSGQMAVLLDRRFDLSSVSSRGTLGLMSMTGSSPQELLADVRDADWSPDGSKLAVIHVSEDECQVEYPIGHVIYKTKGSTWLSNVRVSPSGREVAVLEHPFYNDDAGHIVMIGVSGTRKVLSKDFYGIVGLAWEPRGHELFFGASQVAVGGGRALFKVGYEGPPKLVRRETGHLTIQDIARDGTLLLTRDINGDEVFAHSPSAATDRSVGWMSVCLPTALSADGSRVLLSVQGELSGGYKAYVSSIAAADAPTLLGNGIPTSFASDSKSVLAIDPWGDEDKGVPQVVNLPMGPGMPRKITNDSLSHVWAEWLPDGSRVVFLAAETGHGFRLWLKDVADGNAISLSPEGIAGFKVSPDGKTIAATNAAHEVWRYSIAQGAPEFLFRVDDIEKIVGWSLDEKSLFLTKYGVPAQVFRVDLQTGRRQLLHQVTAVDPAGVRAIGPVLITPDGKSYVYAYTRVLSTLYIARGL